jgi:hypothetical protein
MKHKVNHIHFVGKGGADASSEQGPRARGCERPRVAPAADARFGWIGVSHEA